MSFTLKRKHTNPLALFPSAKKSKQMGFLPVTRPSRSASSGKFEGVRSGVATSGSTAPERKNWDTNVATTSVVTGTPYVASLTAGIIEGTSGVTRVGQKILLKSADIEFDCSVVTTNQAGSFLDIFCIWDKQPDNAVAAAAAIFQTPGTNLTYLLTGNLERFVVLRRERIAFGSPTTGTGDLSKIVNWHIPLELATRFPDAAGSPNTNDLYVCALCPGTLAAFSGTQISYVSRVKFTDA